MWAHVHLLIFMDLSVGFLPLAPSCSVHSNFVFSDISTVYFRKWTNWSVYVCIYGFVSYSAVTPEHQRGAPKEEFLITDVAYCEQAVIFLKQAKLPQNNSQRRKEDSTLPVSTDTLSCPQENWGHLKMFFQMRNFANSPDIRKFANGP